MYITQKIYWRPLHVVQPVTKNKLSNVPAENGMGMKGGVSVEPALFVFLVSYNSLLRKDEISITTSDLPIP